MPEKPQGTCFVVMGFGRKTDFESGRTLDLNLTYNYIIRPAVTAAGLKCVRADEIKHSGPIDVPMYEQLLNSPVYAFLNELTPPALAEAMQGVAEAAAMSAPADGGADAENVKFYSECMQEIDEAQKAGDFEEARSLLKLLRKRMKPKKPKTPELPETLAQLGTPEPPEPPEDPYIIQRLAFVTYKAKHKAAEDEVAALKEAHELLTELNPATSNDTETLGLWGAVHKRLWDKTQDASALDEAVRGYERGFYLRNDYYNGINFAFLLNVRAAYSAGLAKTSADPSEVATNCAAAITDFVQAQRVREEVLSICEEWSASNPAPHGNASAEAKTHYLKNKYWVEATKAEALLGLGRTAEAKKVYEEAYSFAPESWMIDSTKDQRARLELLLADSPLKYVKADAN